MDAFDQLMCCEELNDSLDDFILPGLDRVTHTVTLFEPVRIEELSPPQTAAIQPTFSILSQASQTHSPSPVKLWSSSCGKNLSSCMTFENLLTKVLCDKKTTINWLMEKGLIASSVRCPHEGCGKMMNLKDEKSAKGGSDGYIWCC